MAAIETPAPPQDIGPKQPDISYHPDLESYKARTKRRHETETLATVLPEGFPKKLESKLVWEGNDFKKDEWVVVLTEPDIAEIDSAIEGFKGMCYEKSST